MKLEQVLTTILVPISASCGILLILLVLLSPNLAFRGQTFLALVSPLKVADGPRVVMGVVGSCAKTHNAAPFNCTTSSIAPIYDLSVLPPSAPNFLLDAPPAEAFCAIVLGLLFLTVFTIMFAVTANHRLMPRVQQAMKGSFWPNVTTVLGLLGFFLGFTTFFILRIYLGKTAQDFNSSIAVQGSGAPPLVASVGNGFTMAWVGYGFVVVPVLASLLKFQVIKTK